MSVLPSDIAFYSSYYNPAYDGASTLTSAISSTSAATCAIAAPSPVFPASGEYAIQIDSEVMWVTQVSWSGTAGASTATLTIIRGFGGTSAATHSSSATVTMPIGGP